MVNLTGDISTIVIKWENKYNKSIFCENSINYYSSIKEKKD